MNTTKKRGSVHLDILREYPKFSLCKVWQKHCLELSESTFHDAQDCRLGRMMVLFAPGINPAVAIVEDLSKGKIGWEVFNKASTSNVKWLPLAQWRWHIEENRRTAF